MELRKIQVYVETSVWNFVFADDAPEKQVAAKELIQNRERFSLSISKAVTDELDACPGQFGEELRNSVKDRAPDFLAETSEIIDIADLYINRRIIPERYYNDAVHIAYATYYDIEFLASYNFRHIVKLKTKVEVPAANLVLGYRTPNIISPEELIYD